MLAGDLTTNRRCVFVAVGRDRTWPFARSRFPRNRRHALPKKISFFGNPWTQLAIGLVCMACVANLQYAWTLFVNPIDDRFHWGRPAIQVAFTIFVLIETWLVPVEGYLVDRYGPRPVVLCGGVLIGLAWITNSAASSLPHLYLGAALGGIGTGAVYGTCVGNALKWFPKRRGVAAGITAAGFGAGAALTIVPISRMIQAEGYQHAYLVFGALQGMIVIAMAFGLRKAPAFLVDADSTIAHRARQFRPMEVAREPVFWVMYVMFVFVASGGLMFAASIASVAADFQIAALPVSLAGVVLPALTYAISLDRILDGFGRPFFGWLSDRIGREITMCIAFGLGAVALALLSLCSGHPSAFVIVSGCYFLVFGEIYSLFPATQTDTFGAKYAASNAGLLYTAKGTAALLVPIATIVVGLLGWHVIFYVGLTLNTAAAVMAIALLRPMRQAFAARHHPPSGHDNAVAPLASAAT
jgi:MFS transporter, OFA family, oxalate/formate antiporter